MPRSAPAVWGSAQEGECVSTIGCGVGGGGKMEDGRLRVEESWGLKAGEER